MRGPQPPRLVTASPRAPSQHTTHLFLTPPCNPQSAFNAAAFDVQAMNDWASAENPRVGDALNSGCGLYSLVPDAGVPTGAGGGSDALHCWQPNRRPQQRSSRHHNNSTVPPLPSMHCRLRAAVVVAL